MYETPKVGPFEIQLGVVVPAITQVLTERGFTQKNNKFS